MLSIYCYIISSSSWIIIIKHSLITHDLESRSIIHPHPFPKASTVATILSQYTTSQIRTLHPMPPGPLQHPPGPHNRRMILRIRRPLIEHLNRLTTQPHKLSLERQVADPSDIVTEIIFDEQRQAISIAEEGALDGNLLDVRGL